MIYNFMGNYFFFAKLIMYFFFLQLKGLKKVRDY